MPSSPVRVTFEGLMLFRRDRNADLFDVGVLEAKNLSGVGLPGIPDHSFQIAITPNPTTGSGVLTIDDRQLAQYLSHGNTWNLDVVDTNESIRRQIRPRITTANLNRHDRDPNQHDFAWLVNVDEMHGSLNIHPGHLKPVVRMTNGLLSTIYKTDGIDLLRGPGSSPTTIHFGYVGETVGLDIDLLPGEALVLRVGNIRIFRVSYDPAVSYEIAIKNVAAMTMPMPNAPDHFQVYYALLFSGIGANDRYKLKLTNPREASPNPPPTAHTIDPYKCGGITVGDGDGPLG